jgi:hypothetical protein
MRYDRSGPPLSVVREISDDRNEVAPSLADLPACSVGISPGLVAEAFPLSVPMRSLKEYRWSTEQSPTHFIRDCNCQHNGPDPILPPFAGENGEDHPSGAEKPDIDRECPACTKPSARLLIESALYDYYYCSHCREWSRGRYPHPKAISPVGDIRLSRALTRFYLWKLEFAEQTQVTKSLRSVWRGLRHRPSLE